ncbi:restriction endonuclease subunit S [Pseudohaliea sp.]|uniref:restriction endonuclease subunit S n=1 Tax=Pseudohaliea sp. TaxID=2740289 RepID=UPI0032EF0FC0
MLEQVISDKAGWTRVAFGDVVRLSKKRAKNPEAEGYKCVVGLEHIDSGDVRIRRWADIADGTTFTSVFKPGQVLFGKRRAYQRKVAVADFAGVCSGDIYVLEPSGDALMPELLPFICQTDAFFDHAVGTSAGSLSPRTNWKSLASFEFLLPPVKEQVRLVEVLSALQYYEESLRAAVSKATKLEESLFGFRLFVQKTDSRLVSGNQFERLRSNFSMDRVSEIADVAYGISAAVSGNTSPEIGWPIITGANITLDGRLDFGKLVYHPEPTKESFMLSKGDILLNWRSGSAAHVGKAAIFSEEGNWTYASFILRIRVNEQQNTQYLWRLLNFMRKRKLFGAATSQQINFKMNAAYFRDVLVPVTSKPAQDEIVTELQSVWRQISNARNRIAEVRKLRRIIIEEIGVE